MATLQSHRLVLRDCGVNVSSNFTCLLRQTKQTQPTATPIASALLCVENVQPKARTRSSLHLPLVMSIRLVVTFERFPASNGCKRNGHAALTAGVSSTSKQGTGGKG